MKPVIPDGFHLRVAFSRGRIQSSDQGSRGWAARSTVGSMRRAAGSAVERRPRRRPAPRRRGRLSLVGGDGEGGLVDQVGLGGHHPQLGRRVELGGSAHPAAARGRVGDEEGDRPGLLGEQHVPGEPVALAGPAVVARVRQVPQRQRELHDHPEPRPPRPRLATRPPTARRPADTVRSSSGRCRRGWRSRGPGARTTPPRRRRAAGQSGSKKTVLAPIISQGKTPIGNSAQVVTWKATSTGQANRRVRRHRSSGHDRQSNTAPATRARGRWPARRAAGRRAAGRRGPAARAAAGAPAEPVGLQLGQPGERVDHAHLEPQQPHPAAGDRAAAAGPAGVEAGRPRRAGRPPPGRPPGSGTSSG